MLPGPREKFSETEINYMKKYLESGGSIFVLLGEGGEKRFGTNINFLLEEYGIMVNNDAVVRTNYYKYFHPKECLIQVSPDWWIPAHMTAIIISSRTESSTEQSARPQAKRCPDSRLTKARNKEHSVSCFRTSRVCRCGRPVSLVLVPARRHPERGQARHRRAVHGQRLLPAGE